ncbi:hypothetical protein ACFYO1_29495 [Nocardia sp. NPDC006044]|uniref:hypothetical protein n=1 Tax=Nocardia sp. NPDC006044 TaxID=3364306 RepID=UPI0036919FBC
METAGKWLELAGTLLTMYGLWFAWNRNSNRRIRTAVTQWANFIFNRTLHALAIVLPQLRRNATIVVPVADAIAVADSATVTVHSVVDSSQPLPIQVEQLAGQVKSLANDLQALRQRVGQNAVAMDALTRESGATVEAAVADLRKSSRLEAFADLSVALAGILITAVGIVVGMVADGRFAWLP